MFEEPTNRDRAAWADQALQVFQMTTGTDREDALCDLLCDLMHLADAEAGDFYAERKKAASKTKYTCPACGTNAWAKPDTRLICGACHEASDGADVLTMQAQEPDDS